MSAAVLWALGGVFARWTVLPGPVMAFYRVLFAGLLLLLLLRGRTIRFRPGLLGLLLCFAVMNVSYVTALNLTTAANAVFLLYTAPLWMMAGSVVWFKEPLDRTSLVSMLPALAGIAVIAASDADGAGLALALLSGAAFGGVGLCLRYLRDEDPVFLTVFSHLGGAVVMLPLFFISDAFGSLQVDGISLGKLALFGVVQMGIPYILYSRGLTRISAQEAGILGLIEPITNPLLVWLFFAEVPARATMIGGALILGSLLVRYGLGLRKLPRWQAGELAK